MSLNKVLLIGRLGANPEIKATNSGTSYTKFGLCVSKTYNTSNGEKQDIEWFNIVAFGKISETICKHLTKGSQAYFEGSFKTNKYTDKDGADKTSTSVIVRHMVFLGSKNENEGNQQQQQPQQQQPAQQPAQQQQTQPQPQQQKDEYFDETDLPF